MYTPHTEHDMVWDNWNGGWHYVSHYELGLRKNRNRYVYHGDKFTSAKTGKVWQYYKKGDEIKVRPYSAPASVVVA